MDATEQALLALDRAGADIIELGVPYSVRAHRDACVEVSSAQMNPLTCCQRTGYHLFHHAGSLGGWTDNTGSSNKSTCGWLHLEQGEMSGLSPAFTGDILVIGSEGGSFLICCSFGSIRLSTAHVQAIDVVRRASPKMQASILMFTYFNPIMRRGLEQFCRDIKEAGASGQLHRRHLFPCTFVFQHKSGDIGMLSSDHTGCACTDACTQTQVRPYNSSGAGQTWSRTKSNHVSAEGSGYSLGSAGLLVPDIPLEETGPVREVATAAGLELVLLTTPTTPLDRMEAIATVSQGFVYLVSVTGMLQLPSVLPFKVFCSLSALTVPLREVDARVSARVRACSRRLWHGLW